MKLFSFILMTILLMSCKNDIEVLSARKQKVIPGVKSVGSYSNYIFKIAVKSDVNLKINKILVVEEGKILSPVANIKKEGTAVYIDHIKEKGIYHLDANLRKGNFKIENDKDIDNSKNKAILFYSINGKEKSFQINSFIKEIKPRR